jgi:hypothetical protein
MAGVLATGKLKFDIDFRKPASVPETALPLAPPKYHGLQNWWTKSAVPGGDGVGPISVHGRFGS